MNGVIIIISNAKKKTINGLTAKSVDVKRCRGHTFNQYPNLAVTTWQPDTPLSTE